MAHEDKNTDCPICHGRYGYFWEFTAQNGLPLTLWVACPDCCDIYEEEPSKLQPL